MTDTTTDNQQPLNPTLTPDPTGRRPGRRPHPMPTTAGALRLASTRIRHAASDPTLDEKAMGDLVKAALHIDQAILLIEDATGKEETR